MIDSGPAFFERAIQLLRSIDPQEEYVGEILKKYLKIVQESVKLGKPISDLEPLLMEAMEHQKKAGNSLGASATTLSVAEFAEYIRALNVSTQLQATADAYVQDLKLKIATTSVDYSTRMSFFFASALGSKVSSDRRSELFGKVLKELSPDIANKPLALFKYLNLARNMKRAGCPKSEVEYVMKISLKIYRDHGVDMSNPAVRIHWEGICQMMAGCGEEYFDLAEEILRLGDTEKNGSSSVPHKVAVAMIEFGPAHYDRARKIVYGHTANETHHADLEIDIVNNMHSRGESTEKIRQQFQKIFKLMKKTLTDPFVGPNISVTYFWSTYIRCFPNDFQKAVSFCNRISKANSPESIESFLYYVAHTAIKETSIKVDEALRIISSSYFGEKSKQNLLLNLLPKLTAAGYTEAEVEDLYMSLDIESQKRMWANPRIATALKVVAPHMGIDSRNPYVHQARKFVGLKGSDEIGKAISQVDVSSVPKNENDPSAISSVQSAIIGLGTISDSKTRIDALQKLYQKAIGGTHKSTNILRTKLISAILNEDVASGQGYILSWLGKSGPALSDTRFVHLLNILYSLKYFRLDPRILFRGDTLFSWSVKKKSLKFLKSIAQEYKGQFKSILETLCTENSGKLEWDLEDDNTRDLITDALKQFETLSPKLLRAYQNTLPEDRADFAVKIKKVRAGLFRNLAVKDVLGVEHSDLFIDIAMSAYIPLNMSSGDYEELLEGRNLDCCEHLKETLRNLQEDGYIFNLKESKHALRRPLKDHKKALAAFEPASFGPNDYPPKKVIISGLQKFINLKPSENASSKTMFFFRKFVYGLMFSLEVSRLHNARSVYKESIDKNPFAAISIVHEALFVVYPDVLTDALITNGYLRKNEEEKFKSRLITELKKSSYGKNIEQDFQNAFQVSEDLTPSSSDKIYKVYISKNAASFISMASGGICISKDADFYVNNKNHFHLPFTEQLGDDPLSEKCVGGALGRVDTVDGEKSLVIYAINPSPEMLQVGISAKSICEEVLRIARDELCINNGIDPKNIYIPDSSHGSISNRTEVQSYMRGKYVHGQKSISHKFVESSKYETKELFRVG